MTEPVAHLFVYGTLRPGEVRWQHLAPFVVGDGSDTSVAGELYDTALEYPAAKFEGDGRILGRVYPLDEQQLDAALSHLDEVESAVLGRYSRVVVVTESGQLAWAYECGDDSLLSHRIECGDWLRR